MRYTNINGKLIPEANAFISPDNTAFRYGYGLFETMLVMNGQIQLQDYHWKRLLHGMELLGFSGRHLLSPAFLEEEVLKTVIKNQDGDLCRVKLQVYGHGRGFSDLPDMEPAFIIGCYQLDPGFRLFNMTGLTVGIAEGLSKNQDSLSHLKTTNALVYASAARQAQMRGWDDAILLNSGGFIVETTIANIFWVKDGVVYTPPLEEGCIAGVMRACVLDILAGKRQAFQERPMAMADLEGADEVFLTNAIRRIRWVKIFHASTYSAEIAADLASLFL